MTNPLLEEWSRLVGETYDSVDKSLFFYSLVKMQEPRALLEIGTGVGVCSLYMAQAVKENGAGHVYTVDNGEHWNEFYEPYFTDRIKASANFAPALDRDFFTTMARVAEKVGLSEHISVIDGALTLNDADELTAESHPFLEKALAQPLDLVFCDIDHRPDACLGTLTKILPLLAPSASIFIDSAPTYLASYLALEQTVAQLNAGKVPAFFLVGDDEKRRQRLRELVASRRFTLMHVTERKERDGNSFAWIKVEPVNIFPSPLTAMRGISPDKPKARVPGQMLRDLFGQGD
jgi:predicted O-methyltransferase YrrM